MTVSLLTQEKIVEKVLTFVKNEANVTALIALGSVARNDIQTYSDVNLALIRDQNSTEALICNNVKEIFQTDTVYSVTTSPPTKLTLYLGNELLKLDLFIIKTFEEIKDYFWNSCIPEPQNAILYDKEGNLRTILEQTEAPSPVNVALEIERQIQMFLYAFEAFSNAHHASDGYRSYFEYNLALHRLVRIVYLLRGGREFLFLPRKFIIDYVTDAEQIIFRQLNGKIYLREVNKTKRQLLDFFYDILTEVKSKFPIPIDLEVIKNFCEAIYKRDYFWNLRDLARFAPDLIQQQRLYRSSALSQYVDEDHFKEWMKENQIRTIIDLQTVDEIVQRGYPKEFMRSIKYFNISLVPIVKKGDNSTDEESLGEVYKWILINRGKKIKEIFDVLAREDNYPIVMHCYAGKDRTGIVVALIHLILGIPRDLIIQDYITSGINSKQEFIETLLSYVDSVGGVREYLKNQNISLKIQDSVIKNLMWST
ncbi:MAG: tyrosine-protein phosphatase [Candidatus Hermodarchaeota archaeon]